MSFGGSVLAMITSLKNNARKKKPAFKSWKEDKHIFHFRKRPLVYKQVSKVELNKIKQEIQLKAQKDRRKQRILLVVISVPILVLLYIMLIKG